MHPWQLREIRRIFQQGGVFAYPTEAVYGLGCNPLDAEAVYRILALKQRPAEKGLIIIASDYEQLLPYIEPLSETEMKPVLDSWPGPNTWILPAAPGVPKWVKGEHDGLAVRVTAHPLAAELCEACQSPIISTSANLAGKPPAKSALEVRKQLPYGVDKILSAPLGDSDKPSTIRDARSGSLLRS